MLKPPFSMDAGYKKLKQRNYNKFTIFSIEFLNIFY